MKFGKGTLPIILRSMCGMKEPYASMLAEYLWENGVRESVSTMISYAARTACYSNLKEAAEDFDMDPEKTTWDDILDRDDVEYADFADPKHQIVIRD